MKKILAAMVTIGAIAITPVTALAAPEQMSDGNIFDAEYYAQSNPDVVAVLGTDPAKLYQHYLVAGMVYDKLDLVGKQKKLFAMVQSGFSIP